jgi:nitric oxide reductase subunit C
MTKKQAKAIFIWGTLISAVLFVALTVDSIRQFSERTHEQKLSPQVAEGKWVWQKHNCNDCHTILGIGGYYSPDLTKVMSYRDEAWMARFLRDPHKVWPAKRRMPDLGLSDREIASLISFLVWVNGIDTNDWPPKPIRVSTAAAVSAPEAEGKKVYEKWGCSSCHKMSRRDRWPRPHAYREQERRRLAEKTDRGPAGPFRQLHNAAVFYHSRKGPRPSRSIPF